MKSLDIIKNITKLDFVQSFIKAYPKGNIYLVGGCIRDAILGITSSDFDFVIENLSDEELINFLEKEGTVVNIYGRTFGVVKFKPHSSETVYDIALPRQEKYTPGQRRKHASVELYNITIFDDLARRDFTVNSMAIDLRVLADNHDSIVNYLIDPYDGLKDLNNKIIRTVGDAKERFNEDPTRILRGIRFAVQFGFKIEEQTFLAMKDLGPEILAKYTCEDGCDLQRVSWEMVGGEFAKSLVKNPVSTIDLYDKTGLLKLLLPEVEAMKGVDQPPQYHTEGDVYVHTLLSLSKLSKDSSFAVVLATLLHDIGKAPTFKSAEETGDRIRFNNHAETGAEMAREICHRFCFSNDITDRVAWMIDNHIKIFHSLFNMRLEKQKAFVRNQYFDDLVFLAHADTSASVFPTGKPDMTSYAKILEIAGKIKEEDKTRPIEIITGKEIITEAKTIKPDFDPAEHGRYIGDLKKRINTLYDRNEIKSKEEALKFLREVLKNKKHVQKGKEGQTEKRGD